jgi:hypothetical protein
MAATPSNPRIDELLARVTADPGSRLFLPLAEELRKSGRLDEAEGILRRGLGVHNNYLSAWISLGRVLRDRGKIEEASDVFARALSLDPGNVVAARLAAETFLALGEKREALEKYRLVNALMPGEEEIAERIATLERELAPPPPAPMIFPEPAEEAPEIDVQGDDADLPTVEEPLLELAPEEPSLPPPDDAFPPAGSSDDVFHEGEPARASEDATAFDRWSAPEAPAPADTRSEVEAPFGDPDTSAVGEEPGEVLPFDTAQSGELARSPFDAAPEFYSQPSRENESQASAAASPDEPSSPFDETRPLPRAGDSSVFPEDDASGNEAPFAEEEPAVPTADLEFDPFVPEARRDEPASLPSLEPPREEAAWLAEDDSEADGAGEPGTGAMRDSVPEARSAYPRQRESTGYTPPGAAPPHDPAATVILGDLYAQQGHFSAAREIYMKILEREPGNSMVAGKLRDLPARDSAPGVDRRDVAQRLGSWLTRVRRKRGGEDV